MRTKHQLSTRLLAALLVLCSPCLLPATAQAEANEAVQTQYTCPMHPHYLSTDAEGVCPICGMNLVPVRTGSTATEARVAIDPGIRQSIGVRTAPATVTPLAESLRAFGTVEADEDRQSVATARTEGWIESLSVRVRGDRVERGDVLYTVYSPALLAAQQDFLSALAAGDRTRRRATRSRLRSLGMQPPVIEQLVAERNVLEAVPVRAEASGIVAALHVRDGDYLRPGTEVLLLQSYDQVWVLARIPETQLSLISAGARVTLSFPGAPGAPISSSVDYVYPTLDRQTRTGEIRILVDNSNGTLRPGAYVDVQVELGRAEQLTVPQDAVLYDSRGAVVVIAYGDGSFARRSVQPGLTANGRTAILSGLDAGASVVISGQFLLDAEARLRQGLDRFESTETGPNADLSHAGHRHMAAATGTFQGLVTDDRTLAAIDHLTDMALYLHEALIDGYSPRPAFMAPVLAISRDLAQQFAGTALGPVVAKGRDALIQAQSADTPAALAADLASLVAALEPWLIDGAPEHYQAAGLGLFRDPRSGRLWLQEGAEPLNPYSAEPGVTVPWLSAATGVRTQ